MLLSRDTKGKLLLYMYMGQDDIVQGKCKSILDLEQFDIKKKNPDLLCKFSFFSY